jgi:hypothetical protein
MTLAVTHVFDSVVAGFAAEAAAQVPPATPISQVFGWREPAQRTGLTHRIVWVPGDDASGDLGELAPARQVNRAPRPLATLDELVTVYIEAEDITDPENERAQYTVTRELFDQWYRHLYRVARGVFAIRSRTWVIDKLTRRAGATIRIVLSIEAILPDAPATTAPKPVTAHVKVELLDHEETFSVTGSP